MNQSDLSQQLLDMAQKVEAIERMRGIETLEPRLAALRTTAIGREFIAQDSIRYDETVDLGPSVCVSVRLWVEINELGLYCAVTLEGGWVGGRRMSRQISKGLLLSAVLDEALAYCKSLPVSQAVVA
jgi:hypothetical protein